MNKKQLEEWFEACFGLVSQESWMHQRLHELGFWIGEGIDVEAWWMLQNIKWVL